MWTVVRTCAVTVSNVCGILQIYYACSRSLSFPLYLVPQLVSVCFHPLFKLSSCNLAIAVLFFKGGPLLPVYLSGLLFEFIIH